MRWAVVVLAVLATGPVQARCDSICEESRRDNARLHSEMLSDLRALESNRRTEALTREVEALRSDLQSKQLSDDFYNRRPYRRN